MTIAQRLACVALAALLPAAAAARMPRSISGSRAIPRTSGLHRRRSVVHPRAHFLLANGQAEITVGRRYQREAEARARQRLHRAISTSGGMNLDIVADLSTTPKTLTVVNTEPEAAEWAAQRIICSLRSRRRS